MTESNPKPALRVQRLEAVPGHSMYAEWALPGRKYSYVSLVDLVRNLGLVRTPRVIEHAPICAKPGHWCGGNYFAGARYEGADTRYPGFLVADMPNPCQLPFRMIDGRRRCINCSCRESRQARFSCFNMPKYFHLFLISH